MKKSPDDVINFLIVQSVFPPGSFWNYKSAVETLGAKTPNIPLGLITMAAIMPRHWNFRLVDLNCRELTEDDWAWADLVGTGGMLPQQASTLKTIQEARSRDKFIIVGGADPTSQPDVYKEASARVLDEGELTIPVWLDSWRAGKPAGLFRSTAKPDMTKSPIPRYDLLNINDYDQMSMQISRGCPFNCEFCDIIELYGRKPRVKNPAQVIAEFETIRAIGYTGAINVVDDNFIGNKRYMKREILPAIRRWNRRRLRPFFFTTEASMNLADDVPLMKEMALAGFRYIFTGIETPDPELLNMTQKTQNTMRPIQERLRSLLRHGMIPTGGFIMGFDNEKSGMDKAMIQCINEGPVPISMVGQLVALPNTQLTKRLHREGRLLDFNGHRVLPDMPLENAFNFAKSVLRLSDQTSIGMNFLTTRSRREIIQEFRNVIATIYDPKVYLDRVFLAIRLYKNPYDRPPRWWELKRDLRGLWHVSKFFTKKKETRWRFWRNFWYAFFRGPTVFDTCMRQMGMFLHFDGQRDYVLANTRIEAMDHWPDSVHDPKAKNPARAAI